MSFDPSNLVVARVFPTATRGFTYSTSDSIAAIYGGSDYFIGIEAITKLRAGDLIAITASDGKSIACVISTGNSGNPTVNFIVLATASAFVNFSS